MKGTTGAVGLALYALHPRIHDFSQDESLFGEPARLKQMTGNRTWSCSGTAETGAQLTSVVGVTVSKRGRVSNDPEVVQIITKDLIRNIR